MTDRNAPIADPVTANRILAHEGAVDGFGHVSLRDPGDAGRYLISVLRSPELVDEGDIVTLGLDGAPTGPSAIADAEGCPLRTASRIRKQRGCGQCLIQPSV